MDMRHAFQAIHNHKCFPEDFAAFFWVPFSGGPNSGLATLNPFLAAPTTPFLGVEPFSYDPYLCDIIYSEAVCSALGGDTPASCTKPVTANCLHATVSRNVASTPLILLAPARQQKLMLVLYPLMFDFLHAMQWSFLTWFAVLISSGKLFSFTGSPY